MRFNSVAMYGLFMMEYMCAYVKSLVLKPVSCRTVSFLPPHDQRALLRPRTLLGQD